MCDFILFVEETHHLHILLIEMKLGTESAKKQLDAGECFANYIINTIARLKPELSFNKDTLYIRKIRVSEKNSKKQKVSRIIQKNENGIFEHNNPTDFHIKDYLFY